jgi:hypothetical protein
MKRQEFKSLDRLKSWLATISNIAIFSVVFINDIDIIIKTNNPELLSKAIEARPIDYPEGPYLVQYEELEIDDKQDLDYSKMVMVIAMEATIAKSGRKIGGLEPLLKALADFDYCCTSNTTHPAYQIAGLWVVEPQTPDEINKLVAVLDKYAMAYAFSDGSGFLTLSNFRFNGAGISIYPDSITS